MKRIFVGTILTCLLFTLFACNPDFVSQNHKTKTAKNLPDDLIFAEVTVDDGLNELLAKGVSSSYELGTLITSALGQEYPGVDVKSYNTAANCSAFIVKADRGGYYVGRNFDWSLGVSNAMIVRNRPTNGDYASISTFNSDFVKITYPDGMDEETKKSVKARIAVMVPLDGINEKGLVIGVLNQEYRSGYNCVNDNTGKTNLTTTTAVRMMLNKADTVDNAIALLRQYDIHSDINTAHHLFIADATGKSAVVEWDNVNDDSKKRGMRISWNAKCVTNHPLYKIADNVDISDYGNSVDRYNTIKEALDSKTEFTFRDTKNLLGEVHQGKSSIWSIVFYITPDYSEETFFWRTYEPNNWNSSGFEFSVK